MLESLITNKATEGKSGTRLVLIVALLAALKLTYTIVKEFVRILAKVIVYFGLYVPFGYFLFGVILVAVGAFDFEVVSVDSILFYVGLALCFGVSVCLFIHSYANKPVYTIVAGSGAAIRAAVPPKRQRKRRVVREVKRPEREQGAGQPLFVYHSEVNPNLLIQEYDDHFDVYYDDHNSVQFLRREEKPGQGA